MMEQLSKMCTEVFLKYKVISDDEFEIYVYGFDLLFTTMLSVVSILILASALSSFLDGIIFILIFFVMRMFVGGYHAETHWGCFIVTNVTFCISLFFYRVLYRLSLYNCIFIFLISVGCIFCWAPIVHPNQPLTAEKYGKNRKYIRICICVRDKKVWF